MVAVNLFDRTTPVSVPTRAALKALPTSIYKSAFLEENGYTGLGQNGMFAFQAGDFSTEVAADTNGMNYMAANDTASSAGAWVRSQSGYAVPGNIQSQRFMKMTNQEIIDWGGFGIQDTVDTTKKRTPFYITRTVDDIGTADFTDPGSGGFTQPICMVISYEASGTYGVAAGRGARMINMGLKNRTNMAATMGNLACEALGTQVTNNWGFVIEGYDKSADSGTGEVEGDPDYDAFYSVIPAAGITGAGPVYTGIEINHKAKIDSTVIGLNIILNTYGNLVSRNSGVRPLSRDGILIGPGKDGGGAAGSSYLNDKTGSDIEHAIRIHSHSFDESVTWGPKAETHYGIKMLGAFLHAAISLPQSEKIVFDNDAPTPDQVYISSPSAGAFALTIDGGTNTVMSVSTTKVAIKSGIQLDTPSTSAANRPIEFVTNGSKRWSFRADNSAESGSDAGSNLRLYAVADNGSTETQIFLVTRSTQVLDFKTQVRMSGLPTSSAGLSSGDLWNNSNVVNIV